MAGPTAPPISNPRTAISPVAGKREVLNKMEAVGDLDVSYEVSDR